jgi:hypothetical protein
MRIVEVWDSSVLDRLYFMQWKNLQNDGVFLFACARQG